MADKPVTGKAIEGIESLKRVQDETNALLNEIRTRQQDGIESQTRPVGGQVGKEGKTPEVGETPKPLGGQPTSPPIESQPPGKIPSPPTPADGGGQKEPSWYILTVHVSPEGAGVTTPGPGEYRCAPRTGIHVAQRANIGYKFDHWEIDGGEIITTPSPLTLLMDRNHTVFAVFTGAAPLKETKSIVTQEPKDRFRTEVSGTGGGPVKTEVSGPGGGGIPITGGINVGQPKGESWEIKGPPKKPEIGIDANPKEVIVGKSTTLSWASKNADRVIIATNPNLSGFINVHVPTSGTKPSPPLPQTTKFTAIAYGLGGNATAEVTVLVRKKTEKEEFAEKVEETKFEEEKKGFEKRGTVDVIFTGLVNELGPGGQEGQTFRPLSGVTVRVIRSKPLPTEEIGSDTTDEHGKYRIEGHGISVGSVVNILAKKGGYSSNPSHRKVAITGPGIIDQQDFGMWSRWRPRKEMPIRERVKSEFYQHFGWRGLIQTLFLTAIAVVIYEIAIGGILSTLGLERTFIYSVVGAGIVAVLVFLTARGRGLFRGALHTALWCGAGIGIIYFIGLIQTGALFNMEWYLSQLDLFRYVGVPSGTIESVKTSIRSALSFLSREKPAVERPVAEKIGSWQALDVKFGSKYKEPAYTPTKIYANDASGYILPVTIINPNKIESGTVINGLVIRGNDCIKDSAGKCTTRNNEIVYEGDAGIYTTSKFKLFCGLADDCKTSKTCKIDPEMEREITISFEKSNCDTLSKGGDIFKFPYYDVFNQNQCKNECSKRCGVIPQNGYDVGERTCSCTLQKERTLNNFAELCCDSLGENAIEKEVLAEFSASFPFKVEGNSEFRVVQKETDVKLLAKPKITTSTGPLGITIWFAPNYYSKDKTSVTNIRMFVNIANKGGGAAKIDERTVSMNVPNNPPLDTLFTSCVNTIKTTYNGGKLVINKGDEKEISCSFPTSALPGITGTYTTIPVNVKMDYTYTQVYSQNIPIYKVAVTRDEDKQFIGLPGYCDK